MLHEKRPGLPAFRFFVLEIYDESRAFIGLAFRPDGSAKCFHLRFHQEESYAFCIFMFMESLVKTEEFGAVFFQVNTEAVILNFEFYTRFNRCSCDFYLGFPFR